MLWLTLLSVCLMLLVTLRLLRGLKPKNASFQDTGPLKLDIPEYWLRSGRSRPKAKRRVQTDDPTTQLYKEMYTKLQNLEFHPNILPRARHTLCALLHEGLDIERDGVRQRSILDIQAYSAKSLQDFLLAEHNEVTEQWEEYVKRREGGGGPELFHSRNTATEWVRKQAPVKLVDGAWLGHIHKVTTPFALRSVTRGAWQILSEELGDGDLQKNHVFVYAKLLDQVGASVPYSCDVDFVHPRHRMGDDLIWRAGASQLLVSLFPHEFLPEVLGFNLHFELLTTETLKAARELPEFGISGYYFLLHVSIDNADSGHTAMALGTVTRYLDMVREKDPSAIARVWRRIQAGYVLSKTSGERRSLSCRERRLTEMLRLKADASHQIHCASRAKIGNQTLADWLSPATWTASEHCRRDFLHALANARPWIIRGNSDKSLLLRELAWNGRMFGAFTNSQVEELREWVDNLESPGTDYVRRYFADVGAEEGEEEDTWQGMALPHSFCYLHPLLDDRRATNEIAHRQQQPLVLTDTSIDAILPLWFAHPCLLENMVNIPSRTATPFASHIIRVLRAELGYLEEGSGPAGMDEHARSSCAPDLISLGLEINSRQGKSRPDNIKDVFEACSPKVTPAIDFAKAILSLAERPVQNNTLLLGLALAFLDLEAAVAEHHDLLSLGGREALSHIVNRKRAALGDCLGVLREDDNKYRECMQQYAFGASYIANAIESGGKHM